jgi:hypothetical protein
MRYSLIAVGIVLSLMCFTAPVQAQGRFFTGSLSLETPFGISPDRPQDHDVQVLGDLKLHNFLPHTNLFTNGQYQFVGRYPFNKENHFTVGAEYQLTKNLVPYLYFEGWPNLNDNRLMAGLKYSFISPKF